MNSTTVHSETIHSGHFMASNVHELKFEDDEEIDVVSESGAEPPDPEVTPDTRDDKPVTFYKFGPMTTRSIAIDVSLSKLNKCIQIAYEKGKLTTPKWKNFKGLKLDWKDRIRLNNVIWRAWHMQFVLNNRPKFCFFTIPDEDYWHNRSEASVLEGMYWKRRLETVCAQYTRWRHFYFKHGKRRRSTTKAPNTSGDSGLRKNSFFDDELLFSGSGNLTPPLNFENDDDFTSWFTDTLFSSLNQPYMFPNPKQFAQSDNADLVQPGLIQLQPSLEEIMASLESNNSSYLIDDEESEVNLGNETAPTADVGSEGMDMMPSSSGVRSSSIGSHYTRKDYDDASLLVNYTRQGYAGQMENAAQRLRIDYQQSVVPPNPAESQFMDRCGGDTGLVATIPPRNNVYQIGVTACSYPACDAYLPCSTNSAEIGPQHFPPYESSLCAEHWRGKRTEYQTTPNRTRSVGSAPTSKIHQLMPLPAPMVDEGSVIYDPRQNRRSKNAPVTAELLSRSPKKTQSSTTSATINKKSSRKNTSSTSRKSPRKRVVVQKTNLNADFATEMQQIPLSLSNSFSSVENMPSKVDQRNFVVSTISEPIRLQQQQHSRVQQTSPKKQYRSMSAVEPPLLPTYSLNYGRSISNASSGLLNPTTTVVSASISTTAIQTEPHDFSSKTYAIGVIEQPRQPPVIVERQPPRVYAKTASSVCAPVSALLASPRTSVSSNVLRPIPLNLSHSRAGELQSAFSSLSPSNNSFSLNLSTHAASPLTQQCSPLGSSAGSASAASTDFYRSAANLAAASSSGISSHASFNHSPPTSGIAAYLSGTSPASQSASLLILPPFNGMQFPFSLAMPYAGTPTFCPSTPKEEPAEKSLAASSNVSTQDAVPVSLSAVVSVANAEPVTTSSSSSTNSNSSDVIKAETNQTQNSAQNVPKIAKLKNSTKRAADSTIDPSERKRMQHLHAEQTRRCALKNGFELLEELIPDYHLSSAHSSKSTNASVLMRAADRIRYLKEHTENSVKNVNTLKTQIRELNEKIGKYQSSLPVQSAPTKCEVLKQRHAAYVKDRSQTDHKFWLLHKIAETLFETFKNDVRGTNIVELLKSANDWAANHCNHAELRPVVSQLLVLLATKSPVLSNPSAFPEYVINEAKKL